ncbi:hypothetical protein SAMN04488063_0020 [Halopelagius inordinatus]|uniref:Uncharacterized protein n=1 Tax=Halopelagius inordinatus TaxID=553467 RepID=A0A1I2X058_9EURY|nr:hypothetical protein [Halopelagius inordinatus]SFH05311.1 hypothetical protein SAMN04488063_0020 [Halopelagius inordinatus]
MTERDTPDDEETMDVSSELFDEIPTVENPSEETRYLAEIRFPPAARMDRTPSQGYIVNRDVELEVPQWAVEAARWRLQQRENPTREDAAEFLHEFVAPRVTSFRTEDGRDAVEELIDGGEDGD